MSPGDAGSGDPAGALGAYETAPAIMLACEGDDMVLASANEAAREAFGERCEFGRPVRDLVPGLDARTIELMDDMAGTVLATGRPVARSGHRVQVRDPDRAPFELFWDLTFSPWFADDGSVRGVLAHGIEVAGSSRAGQARDEAVREIVTLQDALLPDMLPVLPCVEIAGRYLISQDSRSAGGDWYDAVALAHGRVALVVGDVASHGVAAAAAMGRLRAVAGERLASGAALADVMASLDGFARSVPEATAATVCVLVLDPRTGELEYCTAGHPPPLAVGPNGRSRYLQHTGAAPLATTGQMTVARDRVERGDLLVLYTNGILTRPGRTPAASTVELGQVAADAAYGSRDDRSSPADLVCKQALEAMTRRSGYADDIAVLVAEMIEPPPPLHLDLPADDVAVPQVLDALASWLESIRVRELDHIVVQHAADELVTNIVEHAYAYADRAGRLTVDAELHPSGDVELRFCDEGSWLPPGAGHGRGHGLSMVRGMVDRLELHGSSVGTVATVQHRLSRPALMLTGATPPGADDREEGAPFSLATDADGLHVAGSLDRTGLDDLCHALDEVSELRRVVLDLEGVTRLPSPAVEALHLARREAADRGQDLVLYAPAGTTAQHVLELVRLPYVLTEPGRSG